MKFRILENETTGLFSVQVKTFLFWDNIGNTYSDSWSHTMGTYMREIKCQYCRESNRMFSHFETVLFVSSGEAELYIEFYKKDKIKIKQKPDTFRVVKVL